jgi:hypothetical protein
MFKLQPPFASRAGRVDSEYFNELQILCEKNLTYQALLDGYGVASERHLRPRTAPFSARSILICFDLPWIDESARTQLRLETLVPLVTAVPVVNVLANLIFCETVALLNLAFELVSPAIYDFKVVIRELPPFLLDAALDLLPISFHSIPVHVNLRRSAHEMSESEHISSAIVPVAQPEHRFVKVWQYRATRRKQFTLIEIAE